MTILVTGATGRVGRHLVGQLAARGNRVRAMTRDLTTAALPAEVEAFQGDLQKPETLQSVLADIDRVFLIPFEGEVDPLIELMQRSGVRHVVVLSSMAVDESVADDNADFQIGLERAVERGGFDWTHLRPCGFMANTLDWAESIMTRGVVRAPYGQAAHPYIHEADIAAVAVAALTEDGHSTMKYELTGPHAISLIDQVRYIKRAINREIRFEELTPDEAREVWRHEWSSSLSPEDCHELTEWLLEMQAKWVDAPVQPLPTVRRVTGRPPRTFAQWADEHATEFLSVNVRPHYAS